ncbi:tail fiber protein [Sodalis sp. dw_96]|uniref:tail fiber protein n=1 Tax=Sodalis sp. dw_96 TaxID=2719794 RepID=UPI001BD2EEC9|nr:tail fiber protein [Sodalis sp. dw_96]
MATNDFKPFAVGAGANVIDQTDYEALAELSSGFTAGKASSEQVNKVLRQATVFSSVLAQFISNQLSADVLDNGDTATVLNNFIAALKTNGALSFLQTANNFSEIKSAGAIAISAALANLNLGDGSALPVGVPIPYPVATPPAGWLKCNGAVFSASLYPKLAGVFPSLTLPDLRGEFIRGWDDGRGVDISRVLLSSQDGTWIQPNIENNATTTTIVLGNTELIFNTGDNKAVSNLTGTNNTGPRDRSYIRPRNVSFNYIVRAV